MIPPLVPLEPRHDVSGFDCGEETLDAYLKNEAHKAQAAGTARTHVWLDADTPRVVGYSTLMQTVVKPSDIPKSARGSEYRDGIPGYLIAKLALDKSMRRRELGMSLLLDTLSTILVAADAVGGRLIVVDALNNSAHALYCRADFTPIDQSYRLWMKVATARAIFAPFTDAGPGSAGAP